MADRIYTTEEIKQIVEPIAREYGVGRLSLFGSYARGEATAKSDIDIRLINGYQGWGWFKLAEFMGDLEEQFGIKVDVIAVDPDAREFLDEIKNDEVIIYEQGSA
jgi:predicted nucleotidyltransferase